MSYLQEPADAYIRAVIGNHVHVPCSMIFQSTGNPTAFAGVFQFRHDPQLVAPLLGGCNLDREHVLVIGDAFFRPKLIVASPHLIGDGIAHIYTSGWNPKAWVRHGQVLKGEPGDMPPQR